MQTRTSQTNRAQMKILVHRLLDVMWWQ
jgi:hypothetical protein